MYDIIQWIIKFTMIKIDDVSKEGSRKWEKY